MNYSRFLNRVSLARKPSAIRVLTALLAKSPPSMISLAGGQPNPNLFPFESAEIKLRDGTCLPIDEQKMKVALQYGPTPGQPDLLDWLRKMQDKLHAPPKSGKPSDEGGMDMCVTLGSHDAICKSMEMLVCEGDTVIIERPTYSGALAVLRPLGCNLLGVSTDKHGMIPESLEEILSKWSPEDVRNPASGVPRVMYTVPNGVNPTGASMTLERKRRVYEVAKRYDLLILEDDPYYFLQYLEPTPTFLSLDVDGRVLRFDSFSKILSSGLRVGFATGPQPLINRIQMHMMVSVLHTPTMSQVMCSELLHHWGFDGFMKHVKEVVAFYESQKEAMITSANKHLTGLAEWNEPVAGMFLWMKLKGIKDSKKLIEEKALAKDVMFVPGCVFMPDETEPCSYVRAAFSLATPERIDVGLERLAALIREELDS